MNGSAAGPPVPMYRHGVAMSDAPAPPPPPEETYQPGELKFGASVNVEYDLSGP